MITVCNLVLVKRDKKLTIWPFLFKQWIVPSITGINLHPLNNVMVVAFSWGREGIWKGCLLHEKWYIKGNGLDLGAEPPHINICWEALSGTGIRQISHRFMSQTGLLLFSLILQILRFLTSRSQLSHQKNDPITLLHSFAIKSSMFNGDCLSPNIDNGHTFLSRYVTLPTAPSPQAFYE